MAPDNSRFGIVQAAAIAHPCPALGNGVQGAQGIDPVLMHAAPPTLSVAWPDGPGKT